MARGEGIQLSCESCVLPYMRRAAYAMLYRGRVLMLPDIEGSLVYIGLWRQKFCMRHVWCPLESIHLLILVRATPWHGCHAGRLAGRARASVHGREVGGGEVR